MNHGANPNNGKVISSPKPQICSEAHPPPFPLGSRCSSLWVKWPERAADLTHLHLVSRLRIMNLYFRFHLCLYGVVPNQARGQR
jgi:hypothetical protein